MGTPRIIRLPVEHQVADISLVDIDAAIALVSSGLARRVVMTGLPAVGSVAAEGLAHAQAEHVAFALHRERGSGPTVVVGPRDR